MKMKMNKTRTKCGLKMLIILIIIVSCSLICGCRPGIYTLAAIQFSRAEKFFVSADYTRAANEFLKVLEIDENGCWAENAVYHFGLCMMEQGNYSRAIDSFENVIRMSGPPYNYRWSAKMKIGECYEAMKDPFEAITHYRSILVNESNETRIREANERIKRLEEEVTQLPNYVKIKQAYDEFKSAYRDYCNVVLSQIHLPDSLLFQTASSIFNSKRAAYKRLLAEVYHRDDELTRIKREYEYWFEQYKAALLSTPPQEWNNPEIIEIKEAFEQALIEYEKVKKQLNPELKD